MIKDSPYISILTDESTDISNTKKVVIYVKILDPKTHVPSTHFFGNVSVEGSSCNAEVLFECICNFMKDKGVPLHNLMGFGSDGASVMTGIKSGVATRFRQLCPHMINIHCMAHRFNLCTSLASKDIPYLKNTFEPMFRDIYYYFDKSANRAAELKELQKVLDEPQLKMKEVHDIRWLAFYDALHVVFHSWKALVKYFKANQKTKQCKDLLSKITDYRFVAFLYMMMDIIPQLSQMSLLLQKSELDIAAVGPALDHLFLTFKSVKDEKSYYQKQLEEHLKFTKAGSDKSTKVTFYGVELIIARSTLRKAKDDARKIKDEFIDSLQSQMSKRFPKDCTKVATAFSVLGLRNLTFLSAEEFQSHGDDRIKILCDDFGVEQKIGDTTRPAIVDPAKVSVEWGVAKSVIRQEMYLRDKLSVLW